MTVAVALAVLVVFDATLSGVRAAAGRDGRIDKRSYTRAAIARGAASGVVVLAAGAALVAGLVLAAGDRAAAWSAFVDAGATCVWVFGAFATATLAALSLWACPVGEIRMLATILVLGPLTLIRPVVIAGGLVLAAVRAADARVWIAAVVAGAAMLAVERMLGRRYA